MPKTSYIRVLRGEDWEIFRDMRLEALREAPTAFGSSWEEEHTKPDEEWMSWMVAMQGQSFVLGAFVDDDLVGTLGVHNSGRLKMRHRANVWGVYVPLQWRGRGIARQLLEEAVTRAKKQEGLLFLGLTVVVDNISARKLYESVGFRAYGYERGGLCVDGQLYDEIYMALEL